MPQNTRAKTWLDARLCDTPAVGIPWATSLAFVRLVSNPRVFSRPVSVSEAWQQVRRWLGCRPVWVPGPTERHQELLTELLPGLSANDVPDAHLAALAIGHGLTLCSSDRGFARFASLRWTDPLRG